MGIVQAQKDMTSYYIIGYYSSNTALDGHFRRIKITVNNAALAARIAKLDYRQGYYAGKQFNKFNESDKEHQLAQALMLGDPITDMDLAMELDYFRLARDRYFVPLAVKIPGSEIELARHGGADSTRLDFIGEIKDSKGTTVGQCSRQHPGQAERRKRPATRQDHARIRHRLHACRPAPTPPSFWRAKMKPERWGPSKPSSSCPI